MILVQILCNEQFFVTVYFKLEKTFSSHFKWTLVPRSTWSSTRWIKMLIKSRKDETNVGKKNNDNNKIKHFYSAAPKKIIWRLSFSLIGANGSLLNFFVWSPGHVPGEFIWRQRVHGCSIKLCKYANRTSYRNGNCKNLPKSETVGGQNNPWCG